MNSTITHKVNDQAAEYIEEYREFVRRAIEDELVRCCDEPCAPFAWDSLNRVAAQLNIKLSANYTEYYREA